MITYEYIEKRLVEETDIDHQQEPVVMFRFQDPDGVRYSSAWALMQNKTLARDEFILGVLDLIREKNHRRYLEQHP